MTLSQRTAAAQELWNLVNSHLPSPEPSQHALWASRFSDKQLERAFLRVSRKFCTGTAPSAMTAENVFRYCTGLLLNLEREAKSSSAPATVTNTVTEQEIEPSWNK